MDWQLLFRQNYSEQEITFTIAYFSIIKDILKGRPIKAFNHGKMERDIGFKPSTSIEDGIKRFVDWYKEFYRV